MTRTRRFVWASAGLALALLAVVRVNVTGPRVHVRWNDGVTAADRVRLEHRYDLRGGREVEVATDSWRYDLGDRDPDNIRALIQDPSVRDTAYIDRAALTTTEGRAVSVRLWYPFNDLFPHPSQLLQLHRTLWVSLAAFVLLWVAPAASHRRRRTVTVAALLFVGAMALAVPYQPSFVAMGGSADHSRTRAAFEDWFGGRVRFEKHLSQVFLLQVYTRLDRTEAAPEQAMVIASRAGTAWFVFSALLIAALEGWSPPVVRYLALVLLAPATLLYFGWREFGYLSLSVAAFPLLARGLRDRSMRLEAGSVFAGLGAALHGSGLVGFAGSWLASLGAGGTRRERIGRSLRVAAFGTAAYLGWTAIYVVVLKMSIHPDTAAAAINSWRSVFTTDLREGRVAAAILSATGARDLAMSAWIVGAPLIVVAASLWRRHREEVIAALWYLPPSLLFLIFRWPFDGVGGGMDLVVAGFPALFALAWVCARDARRTMIAAALLLSAHYAFWRVVLDQRFQP